MCVVRSNFWFMDSTLPAVPSPGRWMSSLSGVSVLRVLILFVPKAPPFNTTVWFASAFILGLGLRLEGNGGRFHIGTFCFTVWKASKFSNLGAESENMFAGTSEMSGILVLYNKIYVAVTLQSSCLSLSQAKIIGMHAAHPFQRVSKCSILFLFRIEVNF